MRNKLRMDPGSVFSSQNRFSILADPNIISLVDDKEQTLRKIKIQPITFIQLRCDRIISLFGELKNVQLKLQCSAIES